MKPKRLFKNCQVVGEPFGGPKFNSIQRQTSQIGSAKRRLQFGARASCPTRLQSSSSATKRSSSNSLQHQNNSGSPKVTSSPHRLNGATVKSETSQTCNACNELIRDKFLLNACGKYWHEECLKCDRCHAKLGELGATLYNKSNMNLCRQDYFE